MFITSVRREIWRYFLSRFEATGKDFGIMRENLIYPPPLLFWFYIRSFIKIILFFKFSLLPINLQSSVISVGNSWERTAVNYWGLWGTDCWEQTGSNFWELLGTVRNYRERTIGDCWKRLGANFWELLVTVRKTNFRELLEMKS